MLVPFPVFDSTFRNEATLECNEFLVCLPDTLGRLYELPNRKSVRVSRIFERESVDRSEILFPCIGLLMNMLIVMRLYSENSLNPISHPPETAALAFAMSMVPEKLFEDGFQFFLCLGLFLVQMETGQLEFFDRLAKLG